MPNPIPALAKSAPALCSHDLPSLVPIATPDAALLGIVFATCGWLYTARKARSLARKQHTITVIMQGEFNDTFRAAEKAVSPHINGGAPIDIAAMATSDKEAFDLVLNRYEFLAAGIRNGDFDEQLVKDTLRSAALNLYEVCEPSINTRRNTRKRQAFYEHLEWLYDRWRRHPPDAIQRAWEWCIHRPLQGKRKRTA